MTTPGQKAYEEDCKRRPTYHDGTKRRSWDGLPGYAKQSWEACPEPRQWGEAKPETDEELAAISNAIADQKNACFTASDGNLYMHRGDRHHLENLIVYPRREK